MSPEPQEVPTPHGPARVHLHRRRCAAGRVMLGHGAGGGVAAVDLLAASEAAVEERFSVALVEQPYRVAGRRAPAPAAQLDAAWLAVSEWLRGHLGESAPLIVGGRSLGARVACRTASGCGASAVLCLAFPLRPPRRTGAVQSRLPELDAVDVPTLVVQGENDRFGIPPRGPSRAVVKVPGDHGLKKDTDAVRMAVQRWLQSLEL